MVYLYCLINMDDRTMVTLVDLPPQNSPAVGEIKKISSTEVFKGPQPVGGEVTGYASKQTTIEIVENLGTEFHWGQNYPTFLYKPARL